jgi:hypothetical protein
LLPLLRAFSPTFVVDVFAADRVAGIDRPCSQLVELVLRVLSFIVGRDPRINCDTHGIAPVGEKGSSIDSGQTPAKRGIPNLGFGMGEIVPFIPYPASEVMSML